MRMRVAAAADAPIARTLAAVAWRAVVRVQLTVENQGVLFARMVVLREAHVGLETDQARVELTAGRDLVPPRTRLEMEEPHARDETRHPGGRLPRALEQGADAVA